jgi:hypothetical protein
MSHDPIRVTDMRAWLGKADMDLKAAIHEMTATPPFTAAAVFHAQRAAGKVLKRWWRWRPDVSRMRRGLSYPTRSGTDL